MWKGLCATSANFHFGGGGVRQTRLYPKILTCLTHIRSHSEKLGLCNKGFSSKRKTPGLLTVDHSMRRRPGSNRSLASHSPCESWRRPKPAMLRLEGEPWVSSQWWRFSSRLDHGLSSDYDTFITRYVDIVHCSEDRRSTNLLLSKNRRPSSTLNTKGNQPRRAHNPGKA